MKKIVFVTEVNDKKGNLANGVRVGRALAALGHSTTWVSHEQAARGEHFKGADLVLAFGTLLTAESKRPGYFAKIRAAAGPSTAFAMWYFDICCPGMKNSPWKYTTMARVVDRLDWLIMTDHSYAWESKARNFLHLLQGVDPADFDGQPEGPHNRARDIIFTGGHRSPFQDRSWALKRLKTRFSVGIFGRDSGKSIFGRKFWLEHQKSRVVFVPLPPAWAPRRYWSNRIYLATATGTPVVAGWTEGLDDHFEDDREVLFFRTSAEMMNRVEELLEDPGLRILVGRAGRERTLRDHTYSRRAQELMETIFRK